MSAPELQTGMLVVETIVVTDNVARSLRVRGQALNEYTSQSVRLGTCHVSRGTDQGISCQLFLTTESVRSVASGHPDMRTAAALIRHQAGRATYYAAVASQIPTEVLSRQRPLLEAAGLHIATSFSSHYFGGRLSGLGTISAEEFAATDIHCCEALLRCIRELGSARLHFIENRDADAALGHAFLNVEQFLCAAATACATVGGSMERWRTSKSIKELEAVSLGDWFELFALDLGRLFEKRASLSTDKEPGSAWQSCRTSSVVLWRGSVFADSRADLDGRA